MKEIRENKPTSGDTNFQAIKKKGVKSAGIKVASHIFSNAAQLISTIVLARMLTPDDFGTFGMVVYFYMFFMTFRMLGLREGIIQQTDLDNTQKNALFFMGAVFSLLLTILFIMLSPIIAGFYHKPELISLCVVISFGCVISGLSTVHLALLEREMKFDKIAYNEIISTILSLFSSIVVALMGFGYWALVARRLIKETSLSIGAWFFNKWRPTWPDSFSSSRKLLRFGSNIIGFQLVNFFSRNLEKILIGKWFGSTTLGVYDRAYFLYSTPTEATTTPITNIAVSMLRRLRHDKERYKEFFINTFHSLAFVAFFITANLVVTAKDLVYLLMGSQWADTGVLFQLLSISIGTTILYRTSTWLHISLGKANKLLMWGIFSAFLICLTYFVSIQYGVFVLIVCYVILMHLLLIPSLWFAGRPMDLKVSELLGMIWKYFIPCFTAVALCLFFDPNTWTYELFSNTILNKFCKIFLDSLITSALYIACCLVLFRSLFPIWQMKKIFSYLHDK